MAQIERLVQENLRQAELVQQLRDEVAVLKGQKAKPKFKASGMEKGTDPESGEEAHADDKSQGDRQSEPQERKRPGSAKRRKTQQLEIHETVEAQTLDRAPGRIALQGISRFCRPGPED